MERKEINEIQGKIVNLVNVVFDVENLINNNKMLVRIKKDTIIIKKNTIFFIQIILVRKINILVVGDHNSSFRASVF